MKISYHWLQSLINTNNSPEQLSEILTNTGLEVEAVEDYCSLPGGLQGLVVGEVLTCAQHPNADKLKITTVNIGQENALTIVCGAPNVSVGQKVVVATVGSKLFPSTGEPFTIQKSKIRGEASEGMLCADDEIGMGQSHDGIIVLPNDIRAGTPVADYYGVYNDYTIEIGLTANRGDAASHVGVARDVKGVTGIDIIYPNMEIPENLPKSNYHIQIDDADLCSRYCGMYISSVQIKESPAWLRNRLLTIGLKPINNIVDCTNYVMHELGQPTHAFDADKIAAQTIIVRKANAGEVLYTLDGAERKLLGHELLIADTEKPLALAGVFGGQHSGVSEQTTNIFLESACFDPVVVRKTAKAHMISTDSSFRFERSTDPLLPLKALHRLANLIIETAGGNMHQAIDQHPNPFIPLQIDYDLDKARKLIGKNLDNKTIIDILLKLDFIIIKENADIITLQIPSYRQEVTRPADITEEVLRIYGLNNIEFPEQMKIAVRNDAYENIYHEQNKIANMLCSQGFSEMMNNSLVPAEWSLADVKPIHLQNPLSNELNTLRNHLLHGTLQSISYNRNRKNPDLRLFEFGKIYNNGANGFEETAVLSLAITGNYIIEGWQKNEQASSYYHIKNHVELIIQSLGIANIQTKKIEHALLDDAIALLYNSAEIATLGYAKAKELKQFDIDSSVAHAQLNWDALMDFSNKQTFVYKPVSKFPEVKRDLSLLLDEQITFGQLETVAKDANKKLLKKVELFDVYRDAKLGEGKKSYALSFFLCDEEKTLDDATIDKAMQKISQKFADDLGAVVRG